jgi:Flp pilus assembly protein TadB
LINPAYLKPLFDTGTGQFLLALCVAMIIAGSLVMGRIIRIEA